MPYFRPVYEDYIAVVMAANHRLAGTASIDIKELESENLTINKNAQKYEAQIVNACHEADSTPRVVASCRNMAATLEMARPGYVITVLPALALRAASQDPAFSVVPVQPVMVRRILVAMVQGTFRRPVIAAVLKALDGVVPRFSDSLKG